MERVQVILFKNSAIPIFICNKKTKNTQEMEIIKVFLFY